MSRRPPDQPRKQPKQTRSRLLVDSAVQAGIELLESPDVELTIDALCERAGISAGSLYQYFPNKESVLSEIFKTIIAKEWQVLLGSLKEAMSMSFEEGIAHNARAGIRFFRRLHQLEPDFYQRFVGSYLPYTSEDEGLASITQYEEKVEKLFVALFAKDPANEMLSQTELEQMAFIYGRGSIALLHSIIEQRPEYLYDDRFMERLTRLLAQQPMFD